LLWFPFFTRATPAGFGIGKKKAFHAPFCFLYCACFSGQLGASGDATSAVTTSMGSTPTVGGDVRSSANLVNTRQSAPTAMAMAMTGAPSPPPEVVNPPVVKRLTGEKVMADAIIRC